MGMTLNQAYMVGVICTRVFFIKYIGNSFNNEAIICKILLSNNHFRQICLLRCIIHYSYEAHLNNNMQKRSTWLE